LCTAAANTAALGAASPGDTYMIQYFAMDYPLYEASYPFNTSQTPAIVGAAGQSDVTISAPSAPVGYSTHRHIPFSVFRAAMFKGKHVIR
jgi:hypothetical protein